MIDRIKAALSGDSDEEKPTLEEVGCVDAHRAIQGEMGDDE